MLNKIKKKSFDYNDKSHTPIFEISKDIESKRYIDNKISIIKWQQEKDRENIQNDIDELNQTINILVEILREFNDAIDILEKKINLINLQNREI